MARQIQVSAEDIQRAKQLRDCYFMMCNHKLCFSHIHATSLYRRLMSRERRKSDRMQ